MGGTRDSLRSVGAAFSRGARRIFEIDVRSLGLFRIVLAIVLLRDLWIRAYSLTSHYSDAGVLPRSYLLESVFRPGQLSFHLINGSALWQGFLFVVTAIFGAMLLVGYRTRLATFASWLLLCSLHNRNPIILQGGDMLMRLTLFWCLFLPLGSYFSLDRLRKQNRGPLPRPIFSAGSAGLLLQVAGVYVFTALLKSGREWVPDGTAVYYALHIEQFAKPLGIWLRQFPGILHALTLLTWYFEAYGPLLLFSPLAFVPLRLAGVIGVVGLHVGFYFCMELGIFPFISTTVMLPFLPTWLWQQSVGQKVEWALSTAIERLWAALQRISGRVAVGWAFLTGKPSAWVSNSVALFFIGFVAWWNLCDIVPKIFHGNPKVAWVTDVTRVDQIWDMFAPYPLRDDGWYVMPGELEDGTPVDVYRHQVGQVSWEEPRRIAATFEDDRWRSYLMTLEKDDQAFHRLAYAQYLCRQWNDNTEVGKRLARFQIVFMYRLLLPNYEKPETEERLLWDHDCFYGEEEEENSSIGIQARNP